MSEQNTIAIISDCDNTLCPDTTDQLITRLGGRPTEFWKEVYQIVVDGWDPPLAYMTKLMELAAVNPVGNITRDLIKEVGTEIEFFPGVLDLVDRLQDRLDSNSDYRAARIKMELFVVSGGIEELIKCSSLGKVASAIFGCSYDYNKEGKADRVKRTVTFTEKTKFVFAINKGISETELREKPYRVNNVVEMANRRIPFEHMIYMGDGPSDIPCFSMIKSLGGSVIGIIPPEDIELKRPYELSQGNRLTIGPYTADYTEGTDLYKMLARYVTGIADDILINRQRKIRQSPLR
jgi:phosphoglycolate phosphatase-like HAD superfamily hydrolase